MYFFLTGKAYQNIEVVETNFVGLRLIFKRNRKGVYFEKIFAWSISWNGVNDSYRCIIAGG